jgi:hypothetical protein
MAHFRKLSRLDGTRDCYWSVASFPGLDGSAKRTTDRALEVRALVIDDVCTKVHMGDVRRALGPPTAVVETSAGNFQWTYRLSKPVAIADWAGFFSAIEKLVGTGLHGRDAVHLFRLPMGLNTKPGRGGFAVRLTELDPSSALEVGNINSVPKAGSSGPVGPKGPQMPSPAGDMGIDKLRSLMKLIPNDLDERDAWVEMGHDLKAMCCNDDEGFTVFDEWSAQHPSYDAGETRRVWDSLGASGLRSTGGRLRARAEKLNPSGYAAIVFDDGYVQEDPFAEPPAAAVEFARGAEDQILSSMDNAARGILGLGLRCRYDAFHRRFTIGDERLTDHRAMRLRVEIINAFGKDFGDRHIWDAITALALGNTFNPVMDMLAAAQKAWDGVARLDRLGPDYFHTEDTALARACVRKVMIAAVRRARRPGCKFDQILVLESPEGWNKSTAWAVLAGEGNFSDANILGKDARSVQEELADIWIHENSDLSGLSKAEVEHVKSFASRQVDRARPAYGKVLLDQPRQSIEVGTTNATSYLLSPTGNRRFWTFTIGKPINLDRLKADRMALWGEAAAAEAQDETLVLDQKLWGEAAAEQEKRRVVDPWEDELGNLTGHMAVKMRKGREFITRVGVHEILRQRGQAINAGSGRRIAEIMRRLGWDDCRYKIEGEAVRGFERDPVNKDDSDMLEELSGTDMSPKNPF